MDITGIICEYNPFHNGHQKQFRIIKKQNPDTGIVCLMSGNYVQRGAPAIYDKMKRAEAAVRCGADLVLELPVTASLSSAEGFAAAGVKILSPFCTRLCFGTESGNADTLMQTASALLSEHFRIALKEELNKGISFPAARQAALAAIGADNSLLTNPNDILAVEYCKAILSHNSSMVPMPIIRNGNYHSSVPEAENPSATAIREQIINKQSWCEYVPEQGYKTLRNGIVHTIHSGERAILSRLRTMTDADFEALPYSSEGLWRKLMHAVRQEATLEGIIEATKSKRYTRTRLDRMIMCAFLGITQQIMQESVPYIRILALNDTGRQILKAARNHGSFVNIGERQPDPYQQLENRWSDLYGLFAEDATEAAGKEEASRIFYAGVTQNG